MRDAAAAPAADGGAARIRIGYSALADLTSPPAGALAMVRFAAQPHPPVGAAPLTIDVRLDPLQGPPVAEVWQANGPVRNGGSGSVRFAHDDHFLFAVLEEDERIHGGIRAAAAAAYGAIRRFQAHSEFPHLLRMWNYLDAINQGAEDLERYRQFCVGRALGLGATVDETFPAATAIGHQHTTHRLQVFWLAARQAGIAVENPRQVSAFRYPRVHGPVSPSFSRATRTGDGTLLISGTASIVGHASQHHDDALEQLEETLRNLQALAAHAQQPVSAADLLKVYVREPALVQPLAARLQELYPQAVPIFLAADICRRELLVEIECVRQHC